MSQPCDEILHLFRRRRDGTRLAALRHYSPDSSLLVPSAHIVALLESLREKPRVVDVLAIHVADVKRAIRTGGDIDRSGPLVAAAEEFLVIAHASGLQARAVRF